MSEEIEEMEESKEMEESVEGWPPENELTEEYYSRRFDRILLKRYSRANLQHLVDRNIDSVFDDFYEVVNIHGSSRCLLLREMGAPTFSLGRRTYTILDIDSWDKPEEVQRRAYGGTLAPVTYMTPLMDVVPKYRVGVAASEGVCIDDKFIGVVFNRVVANHSYDEGDYQRYAYFLERAYFLSREENDE